MKSALSDFTRACIFFAACVVVGTPILLLFGGCLAQAARGLGGRDGAGCAAGAGDRGDSDRGGGARMNFVSLFAGIGGFDLAFERASMRCVAQIEIDDRCREVLAHHWPDVDRSIEDVKDFGRRTWTGGAIDLIAGGFPCQDLSVAGRREGLDGERSGLWFEFHRVIGELRPQWVVIENVPGLLSSNGGRDFAVVLRGLVKCGYGVCWRILDAQYARVPQRRRRVFIVGSLGDGRAAEVLFERTGRAWDPPPSREKGTKPAFALAASVRGTGDGHGQGWNTTYITGFDRTRGTDSEQVAGPLRACGARSEGVNDGKADVQCVCYQCHGNNVGPMGAIRSGNGGLTGGVPFVAHSLNSHAGRMQEDNETLIAFDNGQGDPNVNGHGLAYAVNGQPHQAIAFAWQQGVSLNDRSYPVRAGDYAGSLSSTRHDAIAGQFGVSRLTPRECERLQGFPDDWTVVDGMSDSARYRMLGNAVCVPVVEWIGRRIFTAEAVRD